MSPVAFVIWRPRPRRDRRRLPNTETETYDLSETYGLSAPYVYLRLHHRNDAARHLSAHGTHPVHEPIARGVVRCDAPSHDALTAITTNAFVAAGHEDVRARLLIAHDAKAAFSARRITGWLLLLLLRR